MTTSGAAAPVGSRRQAAPTQLPPRGAKAPAGGRLSITAAAGQSSSRPLPECSSSSPVFHVSRAKKLFAQFDQDGDSFLSPTEFSQGFTSFVSSLSAADLAHVALDAAHVTQQDGHVTLSPAQVSALWKEADLDADGRVSLAEFLFRFAGGPDPRPVVRAVTLQLQTLKRVVQDSSKMSVDDLRALLDAVYDGPSVRFKSVDLSKIEQITSAVLKRILTQLLQAEKQQAEKQRRPMEDWAQHCWSLGGLTQKDCDRLFHALDVHKSGRIDLGPLFALSAQKPARAKGKKKQRPVSSDTSSPPYPLSTVQEQHCHAFINDILFSHLCLPHLRCHPPLEHWGVADVAAKGLQRGEDNGYRRTLFLSERTRLRGFVQRPDGFWIFVSFRVERTELARVEELYHGKVRLKPSEELDAVDYRVKKAWRDGEVELNEKEEVVEGWRQHVQDAAADEQHELSIPSIA